MVERDVLMETAPDFVRPDGGCQGFLFGDLLGTSSGVLFCVFFEFRYMFSAFRFFFLMESSSGVEVPFFLAFLQRFSRDWL